MINQQSETFTLALKKFSEIAKSIIDLIHAYTPINWRTLNALREKRKYILETLEKLTPDGLNMVSEPGLKFIHERLEKLNNTYPNPPDSANTQIANELIYSLNDLERSVAAVEWEIFNSELELTIKRRENDEKHLYDNLVLKLSTKFKSRIDEVWGGYNFDLGPDFEIAICELLRSFLPSRFGVCRGFVVSSDGQREGDDIIVYDAINYPTLRFLPKTSLAGKEQIPIEAVYAYIEAKHTLDISEKSDSTFQVALSQITKVKRLILTRKKRGLFQHDPYINPTGPYFYAEGDQPLNTYRNPVFCMIMARKVTLKGKEIADKNEAIRAISDQLMPFNGIGVEP